MSKSVFDKKLSPILSDFLPEFVRADHPKFVKFLKDYYRFLESGQLVFYSISLFLKNSFSKGLPSAK